MSVSTNKKVKIIIGNHGSGKSTWLYNYLIDKSRRDNDNSKIDLNKKIYLVVPEQDTNDKQRILMNKIGERGYNSGLLNIDVVSFDRLAYTVFEKLGVKTKNVIDDSGKTMILSIVIKELKDKLKYYGKMVNKIGFAKKMTQAMSEFYAYNIIQLDDDGKIIENKDVNKILSIIENNRDVDSLIKDKLSDLILIYKEFVTKLIEYGYSIKEDKYDLLYKSLSKLKDNNIFKDAIFAYEGFTGFTPIQLDIFGELAQMSMESLVVIDYRYSNSGDSNLKEISKDIKKNISHVFYLSKKFVADIDRKISEFKGNIVIEKKDYNNKDNIVYKYAKTDNSEEKKDLKIIEKYLYNYENDETPFDIEPKNVELYEAKNAEEEIINIVHIIKREIQKNKELRYGDIKIVVPNLDDYTKKISNIFKRYDIPVYIDTAKSILNSPYIEAIRAALDVITYNFSYDSIMRYINAGIFYKDSSIFELDNFIREYGIRGLNRYKNGFEIIFDKQIALMESQMQNEKDDFRKKEIEKRINNIKEKKDRILNKKNELFSPLINLYEKINKKDFDNKIVSYISAVERFISEAKIDDSFNSLLSFLDKEIIEESLLNDDTYDKKISRKELKKVKKKSYNLQYNKNFQLDVLNKSLEVKNEVFDIIKNVFGNNDSEFLIEDFRRLLDVGFTDVEIKTIPQSIDQIVVGDLMRSRFDNPKIQICMGFNQSKVPAENIDNTIIDDKMRYFLDGNNIHISQTTFETALNQRMYLYLTITNPTDKLVLSYPKLNVNKQSDEKSSVITAIENLFGKYEIENDDKKYVTNLITNHINKYSLGFYSNDEIYDFIAENMQNLRREYDNGIENIYNLPVKKAIKYLDKNDKEELKNKFNNSFNKISSKDNENLNSNLSNSIYEKVRKGNTASVSYIEAYNNCPYKHFLNYTLKLSERKNFEISPTDLGNYLHKILELLFADKKFDIKKVDEKIIEEKISIADSENIKFQNLINGKEVYYGSNKVQVVKELCKRIINSTVSFIKSVNENSAFESVSPEEEFSIKIGDITFVGKVDKIESLTKDENEYINVIDYKSGNNKKTLNEDELKNGVSMQLLLYIDYCINSRSETSSNVKNKIPCGAFYLWVDDSITRIKKYSERENVNKNRMTSLSYDGLVSDDLECVKKIKDTLEKGDGTKNAIYKDSLNSGFVITGMEFNNDKDNKTDNNIGVLINSAKENIKSSIDNIKLGKIESKPYDEANCKYCQFRDICRKDNFYSEDDSGNEQDA